MTGTTIEGLKLIKVVDGDTIKVELNGGAFLKSGPCYRMKFF